MLLALDTKNLIRRAWEWIGFDDRKMFNETKISQYKHDPKDD